MTSTAIDQLWVADITYIRLLNEFVYLESVVVTNCLRRTANRLSSRIMRATRLWLSGIPRRLNSAVTLNSRSGGDAPMPSAESPIALPCSFLRFTLL
jgi:hypothetical protein